jgi:hypothetical protein
MVGWQIGSGQHLRHGFLRRRNDGQTVGPSLIVVVAVYLLKTSFECDSRSFACLLLGRFLFGSQRPGQSFNDVFHGRRYALFYFGFNGGFTGHRFSYYSDSGHSLARCCGVSIRHKTIVSQ